jgi:hypothetical protein
VLECVAAVRNLRDEEDVQCLLFLADEFALLQSNPFYFSAQGMDEAQRPCSLVLRDTLVRLLDCGLIRWDNGHLQAYISIVPLVAPGMLRTTISWLAALSSIERSALAQAALTLRAQGISARAPAAEGFFRPALSQLLGTDAAEALVRRLFTVR